MIPFMPPDSLTVRELGRLHEAMLRILAGTGMRIGHAGLRSILSDMGASQSRQSEEVRFPERVVASFLLGSERVVPPSRPSLNCGAGLYQGWHLNPDSGAYEAFTERTAADYIKLARLLDEVDGIHVLNAPMAGGRITEPLEARLLAWKYGASDDGGIQATRLCPYILEMYEIRAEAEGRPVADLFRGGVFLVSPLHLPAQEAEQLMYFHERGLRVWIANMVTAGASAPVTLAGCLALNLAESIAIGFINRALYGDRTWSLASMIAPLDMRTLVRPYGRPEMLLTNLANLQLARHYGAHAGVHTGLTDAKAPSVEAGAQKMMTALPCALAGQANIEPGLLSID